MSKRKTTERFIQRAQAVHGFKYDYSDVEYTTAHQKVRIICPKHGPFDQTASKHIQGHECRACSRRNHSNKALRWLNQISKKEDLYIQHAENGGEYRIPGTRYFVDGFCEETNTIYEFYGDVYHGNPLFNPNAKCHPYNKGITAKTLFQRTMEREQKIRELGYNIIVKWENDPKMLKRFG